MSQKNQILSSFSICGYTLRSEASKYVQSILQPLDPSCRAELIKKILDYVQKQSLKSSFIEKSLVEQAVESFDNIGNSEDVSIKFIDAFSLPAYCYHNDTKKFILRDNLVKRTNSLYGNPDSKANILAERCKLIHQRTVRHKLFAKPVITMNSNNSEVFALKSIEYLMGSSAKQTNLIVLGMLTQLKEGVFYLEDTTGAVRLDISKATYREGLFTENSIILAEGYFKEGTLYASAIGFPPPEPASVTQSHFPYFDSLSGISTTSYRLSSKLKAIEKRNQESMFIFMSDVWLDQLKIMQKLHVLFDGYSPCPPTCFVFMGNFLSPSTVGGQAKDLQECLEKFGNLVSQFPTLIEKSYFLFVPGSDDHGSSHILPRPPIPDQFLKDFCRRVPNAVFTTNPCRIQYCSQEIVILREDIVSKMCRNSIHMPWQQNENADISKLFVKTIIANSHLMPLPMTVAPIYWEYDHAFWLYPLPDVVVCADKCDPYTIESTGCIFINPGSLTQTNFSFKVYMPASKQVEDSEITDQHIE